MTPRKQELQPATRNPMKMSPTQIRNGVIRKMPGWGNLEGNGRDIPPSRSTVILHLAAEQM
jgi:hypothetical protein